jgi:hypothetical protein
MRLISVNANPCRTRAQWFEMDWEMMCAYDAGQYEYADAYRYCFRSANYFAYLCRGNADNKKPA